MEEEVRLVGWGYPVRTVSDACIDILNDYYLQFLSYGRNCSIILQAPVHDPNCVLANALAAYESPRPSPAASYLATAELRLEYATAYERRVFEAISSMLKDHSDDDSALYLHSQLVKEFPRDLSSLMRAQTLCFYLGRPDLSLLLAEEALPENQDGSYIYGRLSFPLLELGRMEEAELAARKGLEINKQDVWSQHNLCHVLQHNCHFREAVNFMECCSPSWTSCSSFMCTHNWWHVSICYLEGYAPFGKALDVYDNHIWHELQRDDAVIAEVYLNALGFLLHACMRGMAAVVDSRLKTIVQCLGDKNIWNVQWLFDLWAVWAFAMCEELKLAKELLDSMKSRIFATNGRKRKLMEKVLLLANALYSHGRGDYQRVFELIGPKFDAIDYKVIGASDEQLDIFYELWFCVLLECGHEIEAINAIKEQIGKREGAPFLWRLLEKSYSLAGDRDSSNAAREKAEMLEAAHFD